MTNSFVYQNINLPSVKDERRFEEELTAYLRSHASAINNEKELNAYRITDSPIKINTLFNCQAMFRFTSLFKVKDIISIEEGNNENKPFAKWQIKKDLRFDLNLTPFTTNILLFSSTGNSTIVGNPLITTLNYKQLVIDFITSGDLKKESCETGLFSIDFIQQTF